MRCRHQLHAPLSDAEWRPPRSDGGSGRPNRGWGSCLFDDPPSRHHDPVGPMRARKGAASLSGPAGSKPITIRSRCGSSRSKTSSTNARPRLRAEAAGHRRPARGPPRSTIRHAVIVSSSSQPTRCWRDMDSNHRSLSRGSRFILRKVNWGIDGAAKKFCGGTDGSTPSPSSSESAANPMSVSLRDWAIVTPRLPAEAAEAADRHLYFS